MPTTPKNICYECIEEEYLSSEVSKVGKQRKCNYCGERRKCLSIKVMAERIENAFLQHFERTSNEPDTWQYSLLANKESTYEWEREGEPVIEAILNAALIPEKAAEDIQELLSDKYYDFEMATMSEETEFSSDSYYEERSQSDTEWQNYWRAFEKMMKTQARYFNRGAAATLASIFDNIHELQTSDGRPVIVEAGPGKEFCSVYRARVFQSEDKLLSALERPDLQLGPPPSLLATAGRMNAHGIAVFYGANDISAAIAEVRPPVGSRVAVASFEIIKPIRLLNLSTLETAYPQGSIFDPSYAEKLSRSMFLRSLCQRITRPIMPNDEAFEYLATQAVSDYLATESTIPLDGIIFPSVQVAGGALNVVLFNKAAKVEEIRIPDGVELESTSGYGTEEGWETDYSVTEWMPSKDKFNTDKPENNVLVDYADYSFDVDSESAWDMPNPTLRVNLDTLNVHIVERALYETQVHYVSRNRYDKPILPAKWRAN